MFPMIRVFVLTVQTALLVSHLAVSRNALLKQQKSCLDFFSNFFRIYYIFIFIFLFLIYFLSYPRLSTLDN